MTKNNRINPLVLKCISLVLIVVSLFLCFLPTVKLGDNSLNLFDFFTYTFTGNFTNSYFNALIVAKTSFKTLSVVLQIVSFFVIFLSIASCALIVINILKPNIKYLNVSYITSWLVTTLMYILVIIMVFWFGSTLTYLTITTLIYIPMLISLLNIFPILLNANY